MQNHVWQHSIAYKPTDHGGKLVTGHKQAREMGRKLHTLSAMMMMILHQVHMNLIHNPNPGKEA
jgi:hypothetical protein